MGTLRELFVIERYPYYGEVRKKRSNRSIKVSKSVIVKRGND